MAWERNKRTKAPFRKIIDRKYTSYKRYNRVNVEETLECGHINLVAESTSKGAKRRQCRECEKENKR